MILISRKDSREAWIDKKMKELIKRRKNVRE
jgi:hypothetical protein